MKIKNKLLQNKTVLTFSAHPDDVEYYAGGTLLKLASTNRLVQVVVTNGEINGRASERKKEQKKAAKMVGVEKLVFLNYPDSGLESRSVSLRRCLFKIILKEKPRLVFSFDPENQFRIQKDTHPDHRVLSLIIADLVLVYSNLPAYIRKVGLNLKPLQVKPELWLFNAKEPNHFEDISNLWPQKKKLLGTFKSQGLKLEGPKIEGFHRTIFCSKIKVNEN